ncbi:hypothetical protein OAP63_13465 [Vibrio sp.]|uniref:Uncharacterized protein n=1 Tax=Vibrio viridaestus TaxID=2487322 RepID=A0A3N9TJH1_9VIBR|nr:hypothetical protein [Vibrio viridaestus]MDC0611738.1 hypothetical protein [Vibrio sp.]RQW64518.1 hypothetical protein EES38_00260 [Vibrio viridaestus]
MLKASSELGNSHFVTMDKIEHSIEHLERVHHVKLEDIRQYVLANQSTVLDRLNLVSCSESIESKFSTMEGTFSDLPNYRDYSHYMLEFAVLVS